MAHSDGVSVRPATVPGGSSIRSPCDSLQFSASSSSPSAERLLPDQVCDDMLEKSEHIQRQLRRKFSVDSQVSKQAISAFEIDTVPELEEWYNNAIAAKKKFDAEHERTSRKVAGKATRHAQSASLVWSDIAPILGIVKDVGTPFAGMAIGTIAFVLTVAKNRVEMERRITETLKSIHDRVPGIKTYQRIYQTDGKTDQRLNAKIVVAYCSFIDFCVAAVSYYSKSSIRRWLKAMGHSTSLDETVSGVEQAIVDVRLVCEELLNKNVADVKKLNEEQAKNLATIKNLNEEQAKVITELNRQIEELRVEHDGRKLENISRLMALDAHSQETELANLKRHQCSIAAEFNHEYSIQRTLQNPIALVASHEKFKSWRMADRSRILLLVGLNRVLQASHCWLSTVAVDFIAERANSQPPDPYAFYILGTRPADDTFQHVASSVIFRLLSMNRKVLRDEPKFSELQAELKAYEDATLKGSATHVLQEILGKMALRVLNMFDPSTTIWIILDRLDQCQGGETRNLHRKALLKWLVKLVEDETLRVRLRVLAVVNGVDWKPEEHRDEIDQTKDESVVYLSLEEQQRM